MEARANLAKAGLTATLGARDRLIKWGLPKVVMPLVGVVLDVTLNASTVNADVGELFGDQLAILASKHVFEAPDGQMPDTLTPFQLDVIANEMELNFEAAGNQEMLELLPLLIQEMEEDYGQSDLDRARFMSGGK